MNLLPYNHRTELTHQVRLFQQIGWITLDNASSNDTFAAVMERELARRGISFKYAKRRIRYVELTTLNLYIC